MKTIDQLLENPATAARARAVLNVLLESPYFYKSDDSDLFIFLLRYSREFTAFFESHFGWRLTTDAKCARLYKPQWHNQSITPANRDCFNFTRRDECIAFMLLLEFFETRLEEDAITVDDKENLRFRFGDLLEFQVRRFQETFADSGGYGDETVRRILRQVMPTLERYRFLVKLRPPDDEKLASQDELIYECLPALWHYNVTHVARPLDAAPEPPPRVTDEVEAP